MAWLLYLSIVNFFYGAQHNSPISEKILLGCSPWNSEILQRCLYLIPLSLKSSLTLLIQFLLVLYTSWYNPSSDSFRFQLYNVAEGCFIREDKYVGRKYNDDDARAAIFRFLTACPTHGHARMLREVFRRIYSYLVSLWERVSLRSSEGLSQLLVSNDLLRNCSLRSKIHSLINALVHLLLQTHSSVNNLHPHSISS